MYIFITIMLITINTQHSSTAAVDISNNYVIEIFESSDILQEIEEQDINDAVIQENEVELAVENEEKEIDPSKPMIAITFDDGPSKNYTPVILDVLKENNAKATFFVLGCQVDKYQDVVKQISQDDHELGNHSYSHAKLTLVSDGELDEQLSETDNLIENLTGKRTSLLRPPFGYISEKFNEKVSKPIILWSVDTRDWESKNAEAIKKKVLTEVKDGDIVLMHDIYESTAEAVKEVIPQLIEMGFQFVTVSELYEYREAELLEGQVYSKLY